MEHVDRRAARALALDPVDEELHLLPQRRRDSAQVRGTEGRRAPAPKHGVQIRIAAHRDIRRCREWTLHDVRSTNAVVDPPESDGVV